MSRFSNPFKKILKAVSVIVLTAVIIAAFMYYRSDISVETLKTDYTLPASDFIRINGMQVHYTTEGSGSDLLLLHGTSSSLHTWQGWVDHLKDHYRIIRLDLPAFGLTGPSPSHDYSADNYAEFLDTFTEKLNIEKAHIAGNSLGGLIAFNFAALYPEKTGKLILLNTAGISTGRTPLIFKLANIPVVGSLLAIITPRSVIKDNLEQVYYDDSKITDELIDRYFNLTLREGNREAFIARARESRDYNKFRERLKQIDSETLIIWGRHDRWIPVEHTEQYKKLIRNSTIKIFENAGHVPMEEIPVETAETALQFLRK